MPQTYPARRDRPRLAQEKRVGNEVGGDRRSGPDRPSGDGWTCTRQNKNRASSNIAIFRVSVQMPVIRQRRVFRHLPQSFASPIDCFAACGLLQFDEREVVGPGPRQRLWPAPMKILTCNSNRPLAEAISSYLSLPLTRASVRRFSDMEVFVEIQENVRGEDVFVIQPTSYPANDHLMELLVH